MLPRLINIIYGAFCALSGLSVLMALFLLFNAAPRFDDDAVGPSLATLLFALGAWALGWSVRYVVTGKRGVRLEL